MGIMNVDHNTAKRFMDSHGFDYRLVKVSGGKTRVYDGITEEQILNAMKESGSTATPAEARLEADHRLKLLTKLTRNWRRLND